MQTLNEKVPYGIVGGNHSVFPTARYEQDGRLFDQAKQCLSEDGIKPYIAPEQTVEDIARQINVQELAYGKMQDKHNDTSDPMDYSNQLNEMAANINALRDQLADAEESAAAEADLSVAQKTGQVNASTKKLAELDRDIQELSEQVRVATEALEYAKEADINSKDYTKNVAARNKEVIRFKTALTKAMNSHATLETKLST